jgi:hypothetical protein
MYEKGWLDFSFFFYDKEIHCTYIYIVVKVLTFSNAVFSMIMEKGAHCSHHPTLQQGSTDAPRELTLPPTI